MVEDVVEDGEYSRQNGYVYLWLSHIVVWKKAIHSCKVISSYLKYIRNNNDDDLD